jgi:hypothetical protein
LLALLTVLALGVTAGVTDRAASGVGGVSQLRRRIYWLSLAAVLRQLLDTAELAQPMARIHPVPGTDGAGSHASNKHGGTRR